jgi:hypothetical protein
LQVWGQTLCKAMSMLDGPRNQQTTFHSSTMSPTSGCRDFSKTHPALEICNCVWKYGAPPCVSVALTVKCGGLLLTFISPQAIAINHHRTSNSLSPEHALVGKSQTLLPPCMPALAILPLTPQQPNQQDILILLRRVLLCEQLPTQTEQFGVHTIFGPSTSGHGFAQGLCKLWNTKITLSLQLNSQGHDAVGLEELDHRLVGTNTEVEQGQRAGHPFLEEGFQEVTCKPT